MVPAKAWANVETIKRRARMLLPGATEGTRVIPMPQIARDEYRAKVRGKGIAAKSADAPIEDVAIRSLVATQKHVNTERLIDHATNPSLIPQGARASGAGGLIDLPTVVEIDGKKFIHDGHHRSMAAKLRGEDTIKARVIRV